MFAGNRRTKVLTQADYEANILRLRQERDSLAHRLHHTDAYIEQIHYDFKKLQNELKTLEKQKHDLENTHNKTMKDLVHNQKEAIIVTLKEDVKRLQAERDDRDKHIADLKADKDELQSKLGKVSGEKMLDKNPQIADLSDPRRPQKLVEMISILYDNKWTDAFEKSEDKGDEKQICIYLLNIFKECWNYCKETCEQQTKILEQNLLLASENKDGVYALSPGSSTLLTETRKRSAKEMMPNLYEKFKSAKKDIKEDLHTYVESCLEVCWYSAINEPPMHYGFDAEEQADDFRKYTQGGNTVDFVVWPAMHLFINGPILYKGVAQYKN
ncbi:early endosome antigen 1-like [Mytilus trossulus]|uniref:early endosome antigen 1-like n=1 Tax=Mytilus trossulus TaxID=6551 RepID=UPI0030077225